MHEMSIAQSILDIVDEYMAKEDNAKLIEVAVEIGELVAVVPDSLSFCYDTLVDDTPYMNSKLIINILPLTAVCSQCAQSFTIKEFNFVCSACQSTNVTVTRGQELRITHLEVE
jgi:hydrogenase nickel incorporation protein HypA/HybF